MSQSSYCCTISYKAQASDSATASILVVFETEFWPKVKHIAPVVNDDGEEQEDDHETHDYHSKHPEHPELVDDAADCIQTQGSPVEVDDDGGEDCWVDLRAQDD